MPPSEHQLLNAKLDTLRDKVEEIQSSVQSLDHAIRGNGKTGLVTEIDRLKQSEKRRDWWLKSIWAAFLLALFGLLLGGCTSFEAYRSTETVSPDGATSRSENRIRKESVDPNGVAEAATSTGELLQDVGANIPGWGWALGAAGAVLTGYGARSRVHKAENKGWDEARREAPPLAPPQVVFMPPSVTVQPPPGQ